MSVANFKEVNPILPVRDVDSAIEFYTEAMGFGLSFRDCSAPDKYVGVRRGGVELHLQYQRDEDMPKPGTLLIRFIVDDPDALFAEYKERVVADERTRVQDKPWGTREFTVQDPNGHRLTFYRDL
jgi:uncharacterized glyoxalase superfamily protein PhnB